MKKTILICSVLCSQLALSQSGLTRNEAITVQPQGLCNYSDFTTQGTEMWFRFTAQSEQVAVEVKSEKFGNNLGHIHNLKLYHGNEVTELSQDELPFNAEAEKLKINLNAGNLVVGETYYLRADRKAHVDECNKLYCKHNNSTNPAQIRLCVQTISTYIPNDFNGETAAISHGYELNRGQVADLQGNVVNDVLFYTRNTSPQVYIAGHSNSFVWAKIDQDSITPDTIHRVDLTLVGGHLDDNVLKSEELPGHTNYYLAHNQKGILENKSYARVVRKNVYPNTDLHFYSNDFGLKLYIVVNSGGDYHNIRLKFDGSTSTELTPTGGLKVKSSIGEIIFKKGTVYNINPNGNNVPMPASGSFVDLGNGEYGIAVENYPLNRPVIIEISREGMLRDATPIEWSTYLGGQAADIATEMAGDDQGNFYVCGTTQGINFPVGGTGVQQGVFDFGGDQDSWLAMFNDQYSKKWATYLGGTYAENAHGVVHDNLNDVTYVCGNTMSAGHTLTTKSFDPNPNAYYDNVDNYQRQYLARFDPVGALTYLTYLPPNAHQKINVNVDATGNVYCVGAAVVPPSNDTPTFSSSALPSGDMPLKQSSAPNAFMQARNNGPAGNIGQDLFIMKFSPMLDLLWSTYYGGSGADYPFDIEIDDQSGYLYVFGVSESNGCTTCFPSNSSADFPLKTAGGYFQTSHGGLEGFVLRFTLGGELNWSTFYGGSGDDWLMDGALLEDERILLVGNTSSNYYHTVQGQPSNNGGFPFSNQLSGFFQDAYGGGSNDGFVAEFRPTTALIWSSYIGGLGNENFQGEDTGLNIDINNQNQVFISGNTGSGSSQLSGSFPILSSPYFYNNDSHADANTAGVELDDNFVMGFDSNRNPMWSTYYGGKSYNTNESSEVATSLICVDERVYICGYVFTQESFPLNCPNTINPYCQPTIATGANAPDAYIAQLKVGSGYADLKQLHQATGFLVYPNPSMEHITISWDESKKPEKLEVRNQLGQVLKTIPINDQNLDNSIELEIKSLSQGIYFVTLVQDGQSVTQKMVKQ